MAALPIPILCTGRSEAVGRPVCEQLKPGFDVIHFTLSEGVEHELPMLLKNEVPKPSSSSIGSGNWDSPPLALLLGGAYRDEDVERLRKLVEEVGGARKIPWIRIDAAKGVNAPGTPGYPQEVVQRLKDGLMKLKEEGKLNEDDGGIYLV